MFTTTQWTVVFQAAKEESKAGRPALGAIVEKYWRPLYFYARQQGFSAEDAEDATQCFLADWIEDDFLQKADPAKGRFRSFLLTAWKRYLTDIYRSSTREKRGGRSRFVSLDVERGERDWQELADKKPSADDAFLSSWASSIVDGALKRLSMEYSESHRSKVFSELLPHVTAPVNKEVYTAISKKLQIGEGAAKVALHRLRQRFAQTVRDVIAETLDDPADLESELTELLSIKLA